MRGLSYACPPYRHAISLLASRNILLTTFRGVFCDLCRRGMAAFGLLLRHVRALSAAMVLAAAGETTFGKHLHACYLWRPSVHALLLAVPCLSFGFSVSMNVSFGLLGGGVAGEGVITFVVALALPTSYFPLNLNKSPGASGFPQNKIRMSFRPPPLIGLA